MSTAVAVPGLAFAEANWGRWVARCPAGLCTNAVQVVRRQGSFECAGAGACGWTSPLVWPEDPEAIEVLLSMRPDARTRSWVPGETLRDLLQENLVHELVPPDWLDRPTGTSLMDTVGDKVTGGLLVNALPECRRREIGA